MAGNGRQHAESALEAVVRRTTAQVEVIGTVSQAETLLSGDIEQTARQITELAAGVTGCERVNVWLFNDDESELRCIDAYEASTRTHASGMVLREQEYGPEFQVLKTSRYVDADDPLTDPRTAGYVETYLKPLGITSMLDAVIHASGHNFGLLCFEHVNRPHRWEPDEIRFACQLADKLALAVLSRARRRAESQARATATALAEAQALARVGSWEYDIQQDVLTWSDETYRICGLDRRTFTPTYHGFLARIHPDDRGMVHARYMAAVAARTDAIIDHRLLLDDGRVVHVHERGRTFYDADGRPVRSVGTMQDVTERYLFEQALQARDSTLHAVMLSAAELVSGASVADAMPRALEVVARTIAVDRMLVVRRPTHAGRSLALEYAWQVHDLPPLDADVMKNWHDPEVMATFAPLDAGRIVMSTRSEAGPVLSATMAAIHTRSMLCVPVVLGGATWGCIVVEDCRTERRWNSTELDALGTLSRIIGSLVMRETALADLRRSEERFRAVTEAAQDAIILTDAEGVVRCWNRAAERILGHTAGEVIGRSLAERSLASAAGAPAMVDALAAAIAQTSAGRTVQLAALRKDGVEVPVELSVATMELGADRHAVGILRDITERKQSEARILQMARVDGLTGLANRRVFAEAVKQAISRATHGGHAFAVLYLDLDHFKDVNDTLGHPVGDLLLQAVADRLRMTVRDADTVARFGGDEFAVLQTGLREPDDAGTLAAKLIQALSQPYVIGGNELRSGASIGVTVYGHDGSDVEALLSHADIALYRAKLEGRGMCRFFTEAMGSEVRTRVALGAELREAIGAGQLFLVFQPQIQISTGRIVGVEALVRWAHPQRGVVLPNDFIPAAERTGLVVPLGRWVIREACRQARAWLDEGLAPDVIAVNLSAVQLRAPLELELDIATALAESGLPPERLEIELTETAVMESSREHSDVLRRLRSRRVRLALDDFGTGYSSLEYLHRFPVDRLKIAQSFVLGLGTVAGDAAIVKAALGLARELGLTVIAEGVETDRQLRLLREWGCPEVQGYYFSPPLAADAMRDLLRTGRSPVPLGVGIDAEPCPVPG